MSAPSPPRTSDFLHETDHMCQATGEEDESVLIHVFNMAP